MWFCSESDTPVKLMKFENTKRRATRKENEETSYYLPFPPTMQCTYESTGILLISIQYATSTF